MGGCMSGDVKGGKQAIGGGSHLVPQPSDNNNDGGHNDAVDFFFRSHGLHPLFSQIELSLSASKLLDRDVTSKSDPMAVLYAKKHDGKLEEVGRTEVILNTLNPSWISKVTISYQFEILQPLVIQVYDVDTRYHNVPVKSLDLKDQDFLGEASCFLSEVLKGQLFVDHFVEKEQFSFLDYISSGYELNFMVAVDFTGASFSLAIMEVGEVIQFYDSDKRFPAWGFGGRTPDGVVSHCFNLNGGPSGLEVDGVEGIMSAYATSLHNVSLAGPTLFGCVITNAAEIAAQSLSQDHRKYYVLLIITDGVLTDFQETKDAVVLASDLPLSILIVGVGNADFTQMEILDADNGRRLESSTGRVATRDIVQFVPMREVHSGRLSAVQALLEELPGQFLTYVRSRDLKPVPRQQ
ncbi:Protein BONZAI 3 [Linum perenne]